MDFYLLFCLLSRLSKQQKMCLADLCSQDCVPFVWYCLNIFILKSIFVDIMLAILNGAEYLLINCISVSSFVLSEFFGIYTLLQTVVQHQKLKQMFK